MSLKVFRSPTGHAVLASVTVPAHYIALEMERRQEKCAGDTQDTTRLMIWGEATSEVGMYLERATPSLTFLANERAAASSLARRFASCAFPISTFAFLLIVERQMAGNKLAGINHGETAIGGAAQG